MKVEIRNFIKPKHIILPYLKVLIKPLSFGFEDFDLLL